MLYEQPEDLVFIFIARLRRKTYDTKSCVETTYIEFNG